MRTGSKRTKANWLMKASIAPGAGQRRRARKPRHLESAEGKAFMKWVGLHLGVYPDLDLIYHIPNGGARSPIEAAIMKGEGVKPSMPDYHLPVARGPYIGLYIELKAGKNTATPAQREKLEKLAAAGHRTAVARGWFEAASITREYLQLEKEQKNG